MSQSATSCFVVTFRYQEEGLTDLAKLTGQLTREGFVTSVTDENGVHHELGSNSFAFITVLDQEDVWVHHILQFYSHVKYSPLASSVRVIYVAFCCYTAPDIQPFFD